MDVEVAYYIAGAAGLFVCCVGGYFGVKRCFVIDRRKLISNPHPIEVLIVEVVPEEEKQEAGPPRALTRRELKKQREREREAKNSGDNNNYEEIANEIVNTETVSASDGWFSMLRCKKKYQPIEPAQNESDRANKSGSDKGLDKAQPKSHKVHKKAEQELKFEDLEQGDAQIAMNDTVDPTASEPAEPVGVVLSTAASKARNAEINKRKRREERELAKAEAAAAEERRVREAAYQAMLDAESAEQKETRRKEKEERLDRERREREAEAERKRLAHIQDALSETYAKRREGALLLHSFTDSGVIEGPGNGGAKSLFDIDPDAKTRGIVNARLDDRLRDKQAHIAAGGIDVVIANSGPSSASLPKGWLAEPLMPPVMDIEAINHRKCMVVFNEPKATGWYLGTICGVSRRPGYNYTVKFDKAETASIDIDGIKSVIFDAQGDHAYGRHWVLLYRNPDYEFGPGDQLYSSRAVTTASRSTASKEEGLAGTRPSSRAVSK